MPFCSVELEPALPAFDRGSRRQVSLGLVTEEWAAFEGHQTPTDDEWRDAQESLPVGARVAGTVLSHHRFGFFTDLDLPVLGLVEAPFVRDEGPTEDFPPVGTAVAAVVLVHNPHNKQVRLSIRPSDLAKGTSA